MKELNADTITDVERERVPSVADVRKLQRLAAKLRKRYLSPSFNATEFATREAVSHANACNWTKPSPGANDAQVATWACGWMTRYESKRAEILNARAKEAK